jgi:folate-binding protein YgfZ
MNTNNMHETLTAIYDLAVLEVSGTDAGKFLQGQLSCNINELNNSNSFFATFCNAKGRTISTLLILKNNNSYLVILPVILIEKVIAKLTMYVLRASVKLNNVSKQYCLIGLNSSNATTIRNFSNTAFEVSNSSEIIINLSSQQPLYLVLSNLYQAKQLWTQLTEQEQLSIADSDMWNYQSISIGLAWLDQQSSEQYIPQMLNIDKLGGISFQKGCYTGQEIIARTHYLGKAKRKLFLAECDKTALIEKNTALLDIGSQKSFGEIISLFKSGQHYRILAVIPTAESKLNNLALANSNQDKITLKDFQ